MIKLESGKNSELTLIASPEKEIAFIFNGAEMFRVSSIRLSSKDAIEYFIEVDKAVV